MPSLREMLKTKPAPATQAESAGPASASTAPDMAPPPPRGLVLQGEPVRYEPAPQPEKPQEPRHLHRTQRGEDMPINHPPQGCSVAEETWFEAIWAFDSDLGIYVDQTEGNERAWLAIRRPGGKGLLLLHPLPLLNYHKEGEPY